MKNGISDSELHTVSFEDSSTTYSGVVKLSRLETSSTVDKHDVSTDNHPTKALHSVKRPEENMFRSITLILCFLGFNGCTSTEKIPEDTGVFPQSTDPDIDSDSSTSTDQPVDSDTDSSEFFLPCER